jgi:hypothetical protein
MIIRRAEDIRPSEITPYGVYLNRHQLARRRRAGRGTDREVVTTT